MGPALFSFANSDRFFAYNIDLNFLVPEQVFLDDNKYVPICFDNGINLYNLLLLNSTNKSFNGNIKDMGINSIIQNIIVCIGLPASGKSTFCKSIEKEGIKIVNQDELKTKNKVIKSLKNYLDVGFSVIIDSTNPDIESRKVYIEIAKKYNIPIRSLYFTTNINICKNLNYYRTQKGCRFKNNFKSII